MVTRHYKTTRLELKYVAVGANSLDAATTANSNTAMGFDSLTAVTTGSSNTGLGAQAGNANVTILVFTMSL